MNLTDGERILVVKPSSLGDIIHTLPAVAAVKRSFPSTQIHWLANTEWTPLLDGSPVIDRVIPFPRRELRGIAGLARGWQWARKSLAPAGYDVALDFQGLLRSSLLAKLSGANSIIGFKQAREGAHVLYSTNVAVPDWTQQHAVDRNRELARQVGANTEVVEFPLPPGDPVEIPQFFEDRPILLHPFSRGKGKSLSIAEARNLCLALSPRPVWLVGRSEARSEEWPENVLNLLDRTSLPQLIDLLRRTRYVVSVDSGPMHLAAALSEQILSIHTWSDPRMVGPWRPGAHIWRDSSIVAVSELRSGQFPERRDLRDAFATRENLLPEGAISQIAQFVHSRITS